MKGLKTLLSNAIDYAGLFPPASLDMRPAVENYGAYLQSEYSWMLGRFIIPVSRLQEFENIHQDALQQSDQRPWGLSALIGPNVSEDVSRVLEFNRKHSPASGTPRAIIDMLEVKAANTGEIIRNGFLSKTFATYFEIPIDTDPEPLVKAIGQVNGRAKVRTGGIAESLFPTSANLIRFMSACVKAGVPFKATAGLHHPIRALYRLTYDTDSKLGMMYGFLNLLLTAAFISKGLKEEEAVRLLEEQDPDTFHFEEDGVAWKEHRLSLEATRSARERIAISIGSCSFMEPVDDLKRLRLL